MTRKSGIFCKNTLLKNTLRNKYTFGKYTFRKYTFRNTLLEIHFWKIHFWKIHFTLYAWLGLGPVDWVIRVLPEEIQKKIDFVFSFFFYLRDRYWDICKNSVWGLVEWVGDQLTGWGGCFQKPNSKINGPFFIFFIWGTDTEISEEKKAFGDQLTGWGGSSHKQS